MKQKYTLSILTILLAIVSGISQTVNWGNLQWPASGNTNRCGEFNVYAQVHEPGITNDGANPAVAGTGIEAWIGYSTTNTNPDTWPEENWVVATYNGDTGNNDEYTANIGQYLTTAGTYYYASRFRYNNGGFYYGGYNGGAWNGTGNNSGVATVINEQVNFCNVQYPKAATITTGQNHTVYAQVYEPGLTDTANHQGAGIRAWIGYNTIGIDHQPQEETGWTWIETTYNPTCLDCNGDQNDEYMATFGSDLPAGVYYYASRFQIHCNDYSYGGIYDDNVGNFWTNYYNNGILTINCPGDIKTWISVLGWVDNDNNPITAPTIDDNVIFQDSYNTTNDGGNIEACACEVNSGAVLKITNNHYVRVQNNILIDGEIDIDPQGSLVQVNDLATITLNNTTAKNTLSKLTHPLANWHDYTYWSSPLENAQIETALFQANSNRRFYFDASRFVDLLVEDGNTGDFTAGQDDIDDTGNDWQLQQTGAMIPGMGYAASHNNDVPFIPSTQYMYVFEGTQDEGGAFNTGNINVDIYIDPTVAYNNWNFIGNPYPSAIDAAVFFDHNASIIESAIYLWSHATDADSNASGNQNQNFSQNDYAVINYVGGVATGEESVSGSAIPNGFIPSGQGFFVVGNKGGATSGARYYNQTVFNNAMRVTGNNTQFFRTSQESQPNKLWINLTSDNGVFNQILVAYVDGATNAYDGMGYDAPRNLSTGAGSILYSIIPDSDKKFAIQGKSPSSLSISEVILLGFNTTITEATIYKLSIAQIEGEFMNVNTVYVKDNLLNLYHNLSLTDYHFTSETGEFNNRFEIVFQTTTLGIDDPSFNSGINIIAFNNDVKVTATNNVINTIEVYDILGRSIAAYKNVNSTSFTFNLNASEGTYIVKATLVNGNSKTQKIIQRQ